MKRKKVVNLLILLIFIFFCTVLVGLVTSAQPQDVVIIPGSKPLRILADPQPSRYWIVDGGNGLIQLEEGQPGVWDYQTLPIGGVIDAEGPDASGKLYCSFTNWESEMGVYIFDCVSESVIDTISLDYIPRGLTLSPDQTMLYVLAWVWPEPGQPFGTDLTEINRDSGVVLEINLATNSIERTATTSALPRTIYYAEGVRNDRIIVSNGENNTIYTEYGEGLGNFSTLDVIDVESFSRLEPRIEVPYQYGSYYCDLLEWPYEGTTVAVCFHLPYTIPDRQEFEDTIWIIDPESNSVIDTLHINDTIGSCFGVGHALHSIINLNEVYVSKQNADPDVEDVMLVINATNGETIKAIGTGGQGFDPHFMYELLDGRLIVSGGPYEKILIIDPS